MKLAEGLSLQTKLFVGITAICGLVTLAFSIAHFHSQDLPRFLCYLAVAILASGLKVQLPGIDGTMSVNFLFILLGVLELSLPETLVIGCTATLAQSVWQARKRLDPVKVLFNVFGMMANASAFTYATFHWLSGRFASEQADSAHAGRAGIFLRQHAADFHDHLADRRQVDAQESGRNATSGRSLTTWSAPRRLASSES